jgi:hypothetical protein
MPRVARSCTEMADMSALIMVESDRQADRGSAVPHRLILMRRAFSVGLVAPF